LRLSSPIKQVYYIKRFRYADDTLMAIEDTYIPASMFPGFKAEFLEDKSLYDVMREDYGIVPNSAEESFGATIMSREEAQHFGIEEDMAALHIERVAFSGEICIEYTTGLIRGDKFRFRVKLD
jgi:GntR family transcriptional regulator